MNTAQPIKKTKDLEHFKNFYKVIHPKPRNYLLTIIGLNTALRISDILELKWGDVYDFETPKFRQHIDITEQKTGKKSQIFLNKNCRQALQEFRNYLILKKPDFYSENQYLFRGSRQNAPISRVQAFRIVKAAADYYRIPGIICCHSLRKTFGYHAWKQGVPPALLVNIYNHSSYEITKRYLGIEQEDRDNIFRQIKL